MVYSFWGLVTYIICINHENNPLAYIVYQLSFPSCKMIHNPTKYDVATVMLSPTVADYPACYMGQSVTGEQGPNFHWTA